MTNEEALRCLDFTEQCVARLFGKQFGITTMKLCKKALEKQIPKRKEITEKSKSGELLFVRCICGFVVGRIPYCPQCGQRIDWSKDNDL